LDTKAPTPQGQREKCPGTHSTSLAKVSFYPDTILPWLHFNTSFLHKMVKNKKLLLSGAFSPLKIHLNAFTAEA